MGVENWLLFKSTKEARRCEEFLASCRGEIGVEGKWGCWLNWAPKRLEIGTAAWSTRTGIRELVQREVCRRFDVCRIGIDPVGWFCNEEWLSDHERGAKASYPGYTDWVSWARDWKPEWSGWLFRDETFPGAAAENEELLAGVREIEAFIVARFKELDHAQAERVQGEPMKILATHEDYAVELDIETGAVDIHFHNASGLILWAGSGVWNGNRIEDCPADLGDNTYDALDAALLAAIEQQETT